MKFWNSIWIGIMLLTLCGGCMMPPKTFIKTFDEPGVWRTIEIREDLAKEETWRLVVDTLTQRHDLEVLEKESGYIRTSWKYTYITPMGQISEHYRSRIVVKFLGEDWKTAQVKCETNWMEKGQGGCIGGISRGGWVMGYDTRILEDIYGDLQGKIGRVRRQLGLMNIIKDQLHAPIKVVDRLPECFCFAIIQSSPHILVSRQT